MAVLKFRNLNTGQATPVPTGEFTVGRDDSTYVQVEDASVSRQHARIVNQDDGFYLEDLGSVNGTAARGALIRGRVKVGVGEVVYIGSVPFRVDPEVGGVEPAPTPTGITRPANRVFMRKNTERIPLILPDAPAPVAEEKAPSLHRSTVPMPNPALMQSGMTSLPAGPTAPESFANLPPIRPGKRPEPKELAVQPPLAPTPRSSGPLPLPPAREITGTGGLGPVSQRVAQLAALQAEAPPHSTPAAAHAPAAPAIATPPGNVAPRWEEAPVFDRQREPAAAAPNWLLLGSVFLAGMGAGILIGLFFAKLLFIDLGVKGGS